MGLFAVIGPSRKDHRGPLAFCSRSLSKIRFSSQKRSISRSMVGKSGTFGTGLYMFVNNIVLADAGASVPARAPARHGGRDVASYVSTVNFCGILNGWNTIVCAKSLCGVVLDLDAQRLEELEVLIANLEFSGHQGRLFARLLARLADSDSGFQHQENIVPAFFDSGNDIGNRLGVRQRLVDRLAQFLH